LIDAVGAAAGALTLARGSRLVLLPLLAAAFPAGLVLAGNLGTHVFPVPWIVRVALCLVVLTGTLVVVVRPFCGNWEASCAAAAIALLGYPFYPVIVGPLALPGGWAHVAAALFLLMLVVLGVIYGRAMKPPLPAAALVILAIAVGWTVVPPVFRNWAPYRAIAHVLHAGSEAPATVTAGSLPDVYYVITDGLASPDVLDSRFGVDTTAAAGRLRQLSVTVTTRSRSNYAQTYLSLASSLSGQYIDPSIASALHTRDRRPLDDLIKQGEMLARFRALGYEFVMVGSDTTMTAGHPLADRCFCPLPSGPTELEYVLLAASPLGDLVGADGATQRAHWAHVRNAFDYLEAVRSTKPLLVFAHVIAPHPPFVFAADGSFSPALSRFSEKDGDQFPGTREEYRAGYAAEARFVLDRLVTLAGRLMRRPRRPILVIHGDHGSALGMVHGSIDRTDWTERLAIFSAYGGPAGTPPPPEDISPVNALRWAYSAATLSNWSPLPNRSYVSIYRRPYDLVEVPAPLAAPTSRVARTSPKTPVG
jgi:hypothetical protein